MKTIDADELVKDIDELSKDAGFYRPIYEGFKNWINSKQAVDAVPVVRCRECIHLNVVNRKELYAHCSKTNTVFLPFELDTREHFCSLGERKGDVD